MAWYASLHNGTVARLLDKPPPSDAPTFLDNMPSVRSFSGFALSALGAAQAVLGFNNGLLKSPIARQAEQGNSASCSGTQQLSCHNTTAQTDLCCFNAPGGALLQTQFWDTNPATGPDDSWTIHGLWPDNCDGTYEASCDDSRAYTNITAILNSFGKQDLVSYMNTYWTSNSGSAESFWEHEWGKHGTCISTLDPDCYTSYQPTEEVPDFFERVVALFKTLPSYTWLSDAGITPSSSTTYSLSAIQNALAKNHGGYTPYVGCASGALDELWYFYNTKGSVQTGTFQPAESLTKSNCPSTGIKYLPKSGGGSSPSPTTSSTAPGSSPTGGTFSGSGYLNVISGGSQDGCIISGGTWYTTGTCATFTATSSGSGFTLKSSKGNCGVSSGTFSCGSGVSSTVFTSDSNGNMQYSGSNAFSTDSTPSGSTQATVYTGSGHSSKFTIQWQSK